MVNLFVLHLHTYPKSLLMARDGQISTREGSSMIGMWEKDPTGTAVADVCCSMLFSESWRGTLEAESIDGAVADVRRLMPFSSPRLLRQWSPCHRRVLSGQLRWRSRRS
jgi:hypothetical protein